ncbi:restriction endonuclease [Variovorax sp. PCZ-1]|uniref:restriction endonuclease n=1 Tax=Variovorax sp. PCZ-1 TaxID=2835533 RepID=UPI001BCCF0FB|nr:restriction endonuclease [Variovorax sp. PCZ-1]MBS7809012.1 restriction endonuclease [Variovorax sp. PCZ-1]
MALWLVRAGAHGEFEGKFLAENKLFLTFDDLCVDLRRFESSEALAQKLGEIYTQDGLGRRRNHASQLWPFAHRMQVGDWVILPRKTDRTICIAEIAGEYVFSDKEENPFFHSRKVKWIKEGIPRYHFGQDLLNSFGAFMTVCRIVRNDAENRVRKMAAHKFGPEQLIDIVSAAHKNGSEAGITDDAEASDAATDLEAAGQDQIAKLVMARFKDHGLSRLVEAILQAQGYSTLRSPAGADGGVDILAGSGALGFGEPRLCVQVKSHVDKPAGIKEYNELGGAMKKVRASHGLFVSWAGFTKQAEAAARDEFFSVRLWTQRELFAALFEVYERLPADLRSELPMQKIWAVAVPDV